MRILCFAFPVISVIGAKSMTYFQVFLLTNIVNSFRFTPYNKEHGEIYQSIERLDKMGMKLIEEHNTKYSILK